uniref:hypothetical protein n=1 Tax=Prevotella heparinolytica TaxID=28113 RepID=UPI00359F340F
MMDNNREDCNLMQNEDISEEINLPVEILNEEEYVKELRRLLDLFNKKIKKMKISKEVIIDIETKCKRIIDIIDHVNDEPLAAEYLDELIIKCIMDIKSDPFIVSALNKSYAFRGLAPFEYFHVLDEKSGKYSERMKDELTFFRGRLCNGDELRNVKEIISLPASKIEKVGNQRFSEKGKICLYLGATTYVCARECRWGKYENDMLNISRFHIEDRKDEIQVLNLAISEPLLNGIGTIISRNEQGEKS